MTEVLIGPAELIRGMPGTLVVEVRDGQGNPVDPGPVTVTVTRWDGTVAFQGAANGTGTAPRTVSLAAGDLAQLDRLFVTVQASSFGAVSTVIPVVGGALFWLEEARSFDQGQLDDPVRFPELTLVALRARIREAFTSVTGRRFVPELVEVLVDGAGGDTLLLPDTDLISVRRVRVREGAWWRQLSQDELDDLTYLGHGLLLWADGVWPNGPGSVQLVYEAGMSQVPLEVRRAALKLATSYMGVLSSNLPDRALTLSDELGTFRLATPGVGGSWFGLPEVDAVLQRYRATVPGVA